MSYFSLKTKYIPLGDTYKNIPVSPSDKRYFSEYQYKIVLEGNSVHYDIQMMIDLNTVLKSCGYWWRIQPTQKNINVYVDGKDYLDAVLNWFKHSDVVTGLYGPIDKNHIESLQDRNNEYVYRNKYWYGNYPIKISLFRRFEDEVGAKEITDFIKGSFSDFRLFDDYTNDWYVNYLWLTQKDYDKSYPFLKLSYGDYIEKIQKVKLLEK